MKVKIINLNMWEGGQYTWSSIFKYLEREKPDIVLLQEVNNSAKQDAVPYMASYQFLQKTLGLAYSEYETQFNVKTTLGYVPRGLAIFSRFPLSDKSVVWLHGNASADVVDEVAVIPDFPRNLLHCKVHIENSIYNLMTVQGVWATDGTETAAQREMGQKIFDYILDKENVIIGGDFNVNENAESIRLLEQNLTNIFKGERTTSFNMTRKKKPGYATAIVDFIFCSSTIKVLNHYSSDEDVSDHQSQVVVIEVPIL